MPVAMYLLPMLHTGLKELYEDYTPESFLWGYAAKDLEKARWRIAKELESDRMWVTGEVTMTKRQRIMGVDT